MSRGDDPENDAAPGTVPLSVQVDGKRGETTCVYVLTHARGGLVEVREFRPGCAPLDYTSTGDELLSLFERAHRERRSMSASLYAIRLWLEGLS